MKNKKVDTRNVHVVLVLTVPVVKQMNSVLVPYDPTVLISAS